MRIRCNHWSSLSVTAGLIATLASHSASAASYVFDKSRTEVRFLYVMGLSKQHGKFSRVDGVLQFDAAAPERSQVVANVDATSLQTGEPIVDDTLKGSDFFNVKAEPKVVFKSREVTPKGEDTAEMTGDITINGITKPITLDVSMRPHDDPALKYDGDSREFVATTRIQRSAFNMTAYESMVGDDVTIEIDAIVRKKR